MPYIHGVREQLGEFARPYPYPPIRQPVPLGEFARPYPYPPIRQPVPLGGWWEDFKNEAADAYYKAYESSGIVRAIDSFSQTVLDTTDKIFGEVCSKDAQDQIKVSSSIMHRALSQAESCKVTLRSTPANLRPKLEEIYQANMYIANESKRLIDKMHSIMIEGYKLGLTACTNFYEGRVSGLGGGPAAGTVIIVVAGMAIVGGLIAYGIKQYNERAIQELGVTKAGEEAIKGATLAANTECGKNSASDECREARQHQLNLMDKTSQAFRDYSKRKAEEEQAGVTGTIQTVAIASVVGVLGFMAIRTFIK